MVSDEQLDAAQASYDAALRELWKAHEEIQKLLKVQRAKRRKGPPVIWNSLSADQRITEGDIRHYWEKPEKWDEFFPSRRRNETTEEHEQSKVQFYKQHAEREVELLRKPRCRAAVRSYRAKGDKWQPCEKEPRPGAAFCGVHQPTADGLCLGCAARIEDAVKANGSGAERE